MRKDFTCLEVLHYDSYLRLSSFYQLEVQELDL
jgi:hypothetical protein